DLGGLVALQALGALVPGRDVALGVEEEDRVVAHALHQAAKGLVTPCRVGGFGAAGGRFRLGHSAVARLWPRHGLMAPVGVVNLSLSSDETRGMRRRGVVGAKGFEPSTPCTPCRCATRLRYAPTELEIIAGTDPLPNPLPKGEGANDGRVFAKSVRLSFEHLEDALQLLADVAGGDRLRDGHRLRAAVAVAVHRLLEE